jgi:hypothetical protein
MLTRRKLNYLDKTYVKATLSTTNSTRTGLGLNPSLYGERSWLHEPWYCPEHTMKMKWKNCFLLYIWPPYLDTLQDTVTHILNFNDLPRLDPYLFLDMPGGGRHRYASHGVSVTSSNIYRIHTNTNFHFAVTFHNCAWNVSYMCCPVLAKLRAGGDKTSSRLRRKPATATKLRISSTYSPRSSIHFLAHCSNLCKTLKKIQKFVRPTRSKRQQLPPRRTKKGDLSIVFSVQGTGGSPTGGW